LPFLFTALIILIITFDGGAKVREILLAYAVSAFISGLITVRFVLSNGMYQGATVSVRNVLTMIGVGGHVQVGNILKEAMYKADLYVVTWLLGSTAAGLYSVVLKIVEGFGRLVDAVGLVTLPLVAKYSNHERNKLTTSLILILFPASLVIAFVISSMHESIVAFLFGESYRPAGELLHIGIYALPFISIWKMFANDFIGRGLINQYVLSSGVGASVVIFANFFLLPRFGLSVAPIILVLAYALAFFVSLVSARLVLIR
jgi:O-antigen/teichoic acid export membrane protein